MPIDKGDSPKHTLRRSALDTPRSACARKRPQTPTYSPPILRDTQYTRDTWHPPTMSVDLGFVGAFHSDLGISVIFTWFSFQFIRWLRTDLERLRFFGHLANLKTSLSVQLHSLPAAAWKCRRARAWGKALGIKGYRKFKECIYKVENTWKHPSSMILI